MKKECFEIVGGKELHGKIKNQTSKNAILPIMSASLLCSGKVKIKKCPNITDVNSMVEMLRYLNADVFCFNNEIIIDPQPAKNYGMDASLSKTMRSSLFLLGSTLSKFKSVCLSLPGGCNIGKRPIDIHIEALSKLGVKIKSFKDNVFFNAEKAHSAKVKLRFPSVGATENVIQFACLTKGKTTIINAAREPEIVDLCNFLNKAGAKIKGAGTGKIRICGVSELHSAEYIPIPDRIVSGTIMCAVAMCGGDVVIEDGCVKENEKIINILRSLGCQITTKSDIIHIVSDKQLTSCQQISTGCYPEFATDLQSLILSVCCVCNGSTTIDETIFENRFLTVQELLKMGAKILLLNNKKAVVCGKTKLKGKVVQAHDLRGGAALVIACLAAEGKSKVKNIHFIDRGYEKLEEKLSSLGAEIRRK